MRQVSIFFKKELLASWRSYHVLILLISFLFLGMFSPLAARFTPQILESFIPEGVVFALPEPTYIDSWLQFFKNMSQLQLIIVIIIFSGLLANEHQNQTLPMLLAKGLSGRSIILGKFLSAALLTAAGLLLGFVACLFYTWFYFNSGLSLSIAVGVAGQGLGYLVVIAFFLCFGSLFAKLSSVLLSGLGSLALLLALNIFPAAVRWNPVTVFSAGSALLQPGTKIPDYMPAYLLAAGLIPLLLAASVLLQGKREI